MTFAALLHALRSRYHTHRWRRAFQQAQAEPRAPAVTHAGRDAASRPAAALWGDGPAHSDPVPPVVWMYWDAARIPPFVAWCIAGVRRLNPKLEVRLLRPDDLPRYLVLHPGLARASVHQRADWIRLELLHRHGGIWLDASTVLTAPLDWVFDTQRATGSEWVGFQIAQSQRDPRYPVIENWFLAAPARSRFIADWREIFTREIIEGGAARYVAQLRDSGRLDTLAQAIGMPDYLTMHLCAQQLIQDQDQGRSRYRLALYKAEDTAFRLHEQAGWRRTPLQLQLLAHPAPPDAPALIKLRSMDRKYIEAYVARGLYRPDSLVGRLVEAQRSDERSPRA